MLASHTVGALSKDLPYCQISPLTLSKKGSMNLSKSKNKKTTNYTRGKENQKQFMKRLKINMAKKDLGVKSFD